MRQVLGVIGAALLQVMMVAGPGGSARADQAINFDYGSGLPQSYTVTGSGAGTMSFKLDLNDPGGIGAFGNFSLDVYNAASSLIASVAFAGVSSSGTVDFGKIAGSITDALYNVATWSVDVAATDLPSLKLVTTSVLDYVPDIGASPVLRVAFTGNLQLQAVPGPLAGAGLPSLLVALGALGWLRRRRSRTAGAAAPVCAGPGQAS